MKAFFHFVFHNQVMMPWLHNEWLRASLKSKQRCLSEVHILFLMQPASSTITPSTCFIQVFSINIFLCSALQKLIAIWIIKIYIGCSACMQLFLSLYSWLLSVCTKRNYISLHLYSTNLNVLGDIFSLKDTFRIQREAQITSVNYSNVFT